MFREMRRKNRQLRSDETEKILKTENYGVLSLAGEDGYPYGVPVNYAYADGKLYFHSTSQESQRLDCLRQNPKVCFTVVSKHEMVIDELSTNYESVMVFGIARILTEPAEKAKALGKMMRVLGQGTPYATEYSCDAHTYVMVEITPTQTTGKRRQ